MTTPAEGERVVWGIVSLRAMRVHWALIELGLDYRTERVQSRTGETQTEAFTKMHPGQKIPVFQDGDLTLTESSAIVTYLADRYSRPGNRLIPEDPVGRARFFEWNSFTTMELDATTLYVLRRHKYLQEIYGDAPAANRVAGEYYTRMINSSVSKIDDGRTYLLGEEFSGSDIILATCLDWALRYEVGIPDAFAAYRERVMARPSYAAACKANESP
ncbi:MAG: glutathione S-transferase family protein [Pseudomonadota bacterium]